MARECYSASLRILPRYVLRKKDLNSLSVGSATNYESRVEPKDEIVPMQIEKARTKHVNQCQSGGGR